MPAQMSLNAQQQLVETERLHHVVIAARFESDALVDDVAFGREEDHNLRTSFCGPGHSESFIHKAYEN